MFSTIRLAGPRRRQLLAIAVALFAAAAGAVGQAQTVPADARAGFATADEAVAALIAALAANDTAALRRILGPGSENLINSGDRYADQRRRELFLAAYAEQHKLVPSGDDRMVLDVGKNDWSMPIPVVKQGALWHFDTTAGAQEIINRLIGRDELAAIRVALFYVDAQKDYFERMKQAGGTGEYAQRLISTPNKHDGLYWPAAAGELESPLAPLIGQAIEEGYPGEIDAGKPIPYQGYYFRIIKGQGENAPGGAKGYIVGGKMTGGFALVAWPASYGVSGIMTFLVDQDGVVFPKDLGERTAALANAMSRFDPDISWARVDVTTN
jgi:hypothetical protein